MIQPWKGKYAEIRINDVDVKNLDEFKTYVSQYTGTELRFLDVHYIASAPVRLFARKQTDIQPTLPFKLYGKRSKVYGRIQELSNFFC